MIGKGVVSERSHAEILDSLVCTCRSHTVCSGICGVGCFSLFWFALELIAGHMTRQTSLPANVYSLVNPYYEG